ncbi:MAG TPA: NnrU family protein [Smithellaceae bacterium]|nr:NnrU family protein [Smithellaceae bacterium]
MKYFILATLWIGFCVLHSALISTTFTRFIQRKTGSFYRYHRFLFNIFSVVMLIPVAAYSLSIREDPFFRWDGFLLPLKYLLLLTGIFLFITGARHYSFSHFIGWAQIKEGSKNMLMNKTGRLSDHGILGIVRHPFYAGIFPLLWSDDLDTGTLITNIILSIYVFIGTLLEERKLIREFGDAYRAYQQKVSMLFPLKWLRQKIGFTAS